MRLTKQFMGYVRRSPCHPQWLIEPQRARLAGRPLVGKVLDVGCADRWVQAHCSAEAEYIGLDFPVTGRGLYGAHPDIFADAAQLPLVEGSIDVVVCLEVLEHIRRPTAALAEFARVLKPGGTMFFSMPFLYPIHDAPHDFQRLTQYGLRRDLDLAGLDIVSIRKKGHAVRTAALLFSLALVGGMYARRRWFDYLMMPLALLGVLLVNIIGMALSWVIPDWEAFGSGYEVEAKRRYVARSE